MGSGASSGYGVEEINKLHDASSEEIKELLRALPAEDVAKLAMSAADVAKANQDKQSPLKNSYQEIDGTKFEDVLKRGCMAVVKSSYFKDCLERGEPFKDRAQIPKEYIFTGEEVINLWKKFGSAFLMIISYGWLSKKHPDPNRYHLKRLVYIFGKMKEVFWEYEDYHIDDFGVILDFCSLYQNGSDVAGEDSRTPEELADFKAGLKCINIPYGHEEVTAIKLEVVPSTEKRKYDDRGWTLFESKLIDGKSTGKIADHLGGFNVLVLAAECEDKDEDDDTEFRMPNDMMRAYDLLSNDLRKARLPPLTPVRFEEEMASRKTRAENKGVQLFTSGKDQPFIIDLYKASYDELAKSTFMNFANCGWGPAQVKDLVQVLPDFTMLRTMYLNGNSIGYTFSDGEEGAIAFAKALEMNTSIANLQLTSNTICGEGVVALGNALEINTTIAILGLGDNDIGDAGAVALAKALETNSTITTIHLDSAGIGDEGAVALAKVLTENKTITEMSLFANCIGDKGALALADALEFKKSITLLNLILDVNPQQIGDDAQIALRNAAEADTSNPVKLSR